MNKVMEILNLVMVSQYLILHEITLSTLLTSCFGEKYFMQTNHFDWTMQCIAQEIHLKLD